MATTKRLVCLANSRKMSERCIAGIEVGSRSWVRPVSSRSARAVPERERRYAGGTEPSVLDVMSVRLLKPDPFKFQRENWILDPKVRWEREGRIGWDELCLLEQRPKRLWVNSADSSRNGRNDRVPEEQQFAVMDSLKLIRADSVTIMVDPSPRDGGRLEVRAGFRYAGSTYILRVTDCVYEERFGARGPGRYGLGESFLTVSLGEPFADGYMYKLVAAIVECVDVRSGGRP